jgi:two-component system cell cycle sensor histidine kinase/response regulator CckA
MVQVNDETEVRRHNAALQERVAELESALAELKQVEKALRESEERFWSLLENAPIGYQSLNEKGDLIWANETWCQTLGYTREELLGRNFSEFLFPDFHKHFHENFPQFKSQGFIRGVEFKMIRKDGTEISASIDGKIEYKDDGSFKQTHCAVQDITERKKAEDALNREKERAESYLKLAGVIMVAIDTQGLVTMINRKGCDILGYDEADVLGKDWFLNFVPERITKVIKPVSEQLLHGEIEPVEFFENPVLTKSGQERLIAWHNRIIKSESGEIIGHLSSGEDITEREKLQAQLVQAQKMESLGRMAGGVAHDFNNMLGAILGHAEVAMENVDPSLQLHADLTGIRSAAERSADLTRQLLAFARKQTITPRVLDLNEAVSGMLKMLRRLIGEDIELVWLPGTDVWPVKVDPSQLDQILANLSLNAQDAITGVGRVTIETGQAFFDETYCSEIQGFIPGEYAQLTVSDTGCGMDKETQDRLYEPFFTTKEMGKGTGLGLATVYGIVKQNQGFISVYSELGQGTSFKIFLPRQEGKPEIIPQKNAGVSVPRGNETILLVEDEPLILNLTTRMLKGLGYTVLAASTPSEAIRLAESHSSEIPLICTDVVMPEMSGLDLAKILGSSYPSIKCLYMSGYTANVITHHGVLDEGVQFIQKPFMIGDLAAKVRQTLDGG